MTFIAQLLNGPMNRAHSVYRYSSRPVIKAESVAEHTFFVMLYSDMINAKLGYPADTGDLLRRALIHDIDECVTGDFVRSFKYSDPELRRHLQRASDVFVQDMLSSYNVPTGSLYGAWNRGKSQGIEGDILRVSDFLSVVAYLMRELQMGNATMLDVVAECESYGLTVSTQVLDDTLKDMALEAVEQLLQEADRHARPTTD